MAGKQLPHEQLRGLFALWVKEAREKRYEGNRTRMAEDVGVSRETLWKIEKEQTDADEETVAKLSLKIGPPPVLSTGQQQAPSRAVKEEVASGKVRAPGGGEESGGVATDIPVAEDPHTMLAQWMVNHWTRIAQKHEITGPDLIPLLEREAAWFRENGYLESYDCTLDLIRSIRFFVRTGRHQSDRPEDGGPDRGGDYAALITWFLAHFLYLQALIA